MFDSIRYWLAEKGVKSYLPSLIRGGFKLLAGYLAAKGVPGAENVEGLSQPVVDILVPVTLFLLAQLWSWKDKPATPKPVLVK